METTFEQQKEKSVETLMKMRELNTLMDIKLYINNKKSILEYKEIDEYEYVENNSKLDVYTELEFFIDSKIGKLKQ